MSVHRIIRSMDSYSAILCTVAVSKSYAYSADPDSTVGSADASRTRIKELFSNVQINASRAAISATIGIELDVFSQSASAAATSWLIIAVLPTDFALPAESVR